MKHWLYTIETIDTEQVYAGITSRANPFGRFSEHIYSLVAGDHPPPKFQECWDNNPTICNLIFRCVARYDTKDEAAFNEARLVSELRPYERLNGLMPGQGGYLLFKVSQLESSGYSGNQIAETLGVSASWISKLRKKIRDSKVFQ